MNFLKFNRNKFWEDYFIKSTERSQTHLVTIDLKEQTVHCDCEDFKYRKENLKFGGVKLSDIENHCKHIREVLKIRKVLIDGETKNKKSEK